MLFNTDKSRDRYSFKVSLKLLLSVIIQFSKFLNLSSNNPSFEIITGVPADKLCRKRSAQELLVF